MCFSERVGAVPPGGKAVLKTPHSKRFAKSGDARQSRQRLECGVFSTARTWTHPHSNPFDVIGQHAALFEFAQKLDDIGLIRIAKAGLQFFGDKSRT